MLRALTSLALAAAACTPTERPAAAPAPVVQPAPPPDPAKPVVVEAAELGWRWQMGQPFDAVGRNWGPEEYTVARGPVSLRVTQGDPLTIAREGEPSWSTRLSRGSDRAAAMLDDGSLYVAHFHAIATGANVARIDVTDGSVVWDHPLFGAGPIGHSKYANDVQIDIVGDRLHVFGWESGGAYTEVVSLSTGAQLAHRPAPADLVAMLWSWTGDREAWDGPNRVLSVADFGDIELTGGVAKLPSGTEVRLSEHDGSMPTGAALMHDGTLFIAVGDAISSGASLHAISPGDGRLRWSTPLYGIGPTAHSEYFNELQLSVHHGVVVVYGNEANGRYLEAVDPKTGTAIVSKIWMP